LQEFSRALSSWTIAFLLIQGLLQLQQVGPSLKKLLSVPIAGLIKEDTMLHMLSSSGRYGIPISEIMPQ